MKTIALRQRRAEQGLTRVDVYAHPDDHAAIKALAEKLQAKRERAAKKAPPPDPLWKGVVTHRMTFDAPVTVLADEVLEVAFAYGKATAKAVPAKRRLTKPKPP